MQHVFNRCLLGLGVFLAGITAKAQDGVARKYSNEFLNIGVDARSMGMANSVLGNVEGVYAGFWNPAGIVQGDKKVDVGIMHAEYFASIAQYDYLAGVYQLDERSAVGISLIRFGIDNIQNTLQLRDQDGNIDYDRITKFSAADYAFIFSYGRKSATVEGLSFGGNGKVIYRSLGQFADAFGFGLDVGMQYRRGKWRFGAVGRDVTTTINTWAIKSNELEDVFRETGNAMPESGLELTLPKVLLGAGRLFDLNENFSLLMELSAYATFDGERNALLSGGVASLYPGFGFEFGYKKFVFVRGGVGNFQRERNFDDSQYITLQPNLGLGFHYKGIAVDYALTDIGDQSVAMYSHIFSLRFGIGDL